MKSMKAVGYVYNMRRAVMIGGSDPDPPGPYTLESSCPYECLRALSGHFISTFDEFIVFCNAQSRNPIKLSFPVKRKPRYLHEISDHKSTHSVNISGSQFSKALKHLIKPGTLCDSELKSLGDNVAKEINRHVDDETIFNVDNVIYEARNILLHLKTKNLSDATRQLFDSFEFKVDDCEYFCELDNALIFDKHIIQISKTPQYSIYTPSDTFHQLTKTLDPTKLDTLASELFTINESDTLISHEINPLIDNSTTLSILRETLVSWFRDGKKAQLGSLSQLLDIYLSFIYMCNDYIHGLETLILLNDLSSSLPKIKQLSFTMNELRLFSTYATLVSIELPILPSLDDRHRLIAGLPPLGNFLYRIAFKNILYTNESVENLNTFALWSDAAFLTHPLVTLTIGPLVVTFSSLHVKIVDNINRISNQLRLNMPRSERFEIDIFIDSPLKNVGSDNKVSNLDCASDDKLSLFSCERVLKIYLNDLELVTYSLPNSTNLIYFNISEHTSVERLHPMTQTHKRLLEWERILKSSNMGFPPKIGSLNDAIEFYLTSLHRLSYNYGILRSGSFSKLSRMLGIISKILPFNPRICHSIGILKHDVLIKFNSFISTKLMDLLNEIVKIDGGDVPVLSLLCSLSECRLYELMLQSPITSVSQLLYTLSGPKYYNNCMMKSVLNRLIKLVTPELIATSVTKERDIVESGFVESGGSYKFQLTHWYHLFMKISNDTITPFLSSFIKHAVLHITAVISQYDLESDEYSGELFNAISFLVSKTLDFSIRFEDYEGSAHASITKDISLIICTFYHLVNPNSFDDEESKVDFMGDNLFPQRLQTLLSVWPKLICSATFCKSECSALCTHIVLYFCNYIKSINLPCVSLCKLLCNSRYLPKLIDRYKVDFKLTPIFPLLLKCIKLISTPLVETHKDEKLKYHSVVTQTISPHPYHPILPDSLPVSLPDSLPDSSFDFERANESPVSLASSPIPSPESSPTNRANIRHSFKKGLAEASDHLMSTVEAFITSDAHSKAVEMYSLKLMGKVQEIKSKAGAIPPFKLVLYDQTLEFNSLSELEGHFFKQIHRRCRLVSMLIINKGTLSFSPVRKRYYRSWRSNSLPCIYDENVTQCPELSQGEVDCRDLVELLDLLTMGPPPELIIQSIYSQQLQSLLMYLSVHSILALLPHEDNSRCGYASGAAFGNFSALSNFATLSKVVGNIAIQAVNGGFTRGLCPLSDEITVPMNCCVIILFTLLNSLHRHAAHEKPGKLGNMCENDKLGNSTDIFPALLVLFSSLLLGPFNDTRLANPLIKQLFAGSALAESDSVTSIFPLLWIYLIGHVSESHALSSAASSNYDLLKTQKTLIWGVLQSIKFYSSNDAISYSPACVNSIDSSPSLILMVELRKIFERVASLPLFRYLFEAILATFAIGTHHSRVVTTKLGVPISQLLDVAIRKLHYFESKELQSRAGQSAIVSDSAGYCNCQIPSNFLDSDASPSVVREMIERGGGQIAGNNERAIVAEIVANEEDAHSAAHTPSRGRTLNDSSTRCELGDRAHSQVPVESPALRNLGSVDKVQGEYLSNWLPSLGAIPSELINTPVRFPSNRTGVDEAPLDNCGDSGPSFFKVLPHKFHLEQRYPAANLVSNEYFLSQGPSSSFSPLLVGPNIFITSSSGLGGIVIFPIPSGLDFPSFQQSFEGIQTSVASFTICMGGHFGVTVAPADVVHSNVSELFNRNDAVLFVSGDPLEKVSSSERYATNVSFNPGDTLEANFALHIDANSQFCLRTELSVAGNSIGSILEVLYDPETQKDPCRRMSLIFIFPTVQTLIFDNSPALPSNDYTPINSLLNMNVSPIELDQNDNPVSAAAEQMDFSSNIIPNLPHHTDHPDLPSFNFEANLPNYQAPTPRTPSFSGQTPAPPSAGLHQLIPPETLDSLASGAPNLDIEDILNEANGNSDSNNQASLVNFSAGSLSMSVMGSLSFKRAQSVEMNINYLMNFIDKLQLYQSILMVNFKLIGSLASILIQRWLDREMITGAEDSIIPGWMAVLACDISKPAWHMAKNLLTIRLACVKVGRDISHHIAGLTLPWLSSSSCISHSPISRLPTGLLMDILRRFNDPAIFWWSQPFMLVILTLVIKTLARRVPPCRESEFTKLLESFADTLYSLDPKGLPACQSANYSGTMGRSDADELGSADHHRLYHCASIYYSVASIADLNAQLMQTIPMYVVSLLAKLTPARLGPDSIFFRLFATPACPQAPGGAKKCACSICGDATEIWVNFTRLYVSETGNLPFYLDRNLPAHGLLALLTCIPDLHELPPLHQLLIEKAAGLESLDEVPPKTLFKLYFYHLNCKRGTKRGAIEKCVLTGIKDISFSIEDVGGFLIDSFSSTPNVTTNFNLKLPAHFQRYQTAMKLHRLACIWAYQARLCPPRLEPSTPNIHKFRKLAIYLIICSRRYSFSSTHSPCGALMDEFKRSGSNNESFIAESFGPCDADAILPGFFLDSFLGKGRFGLTGYNWVVPLKAAIDHLHGDAPEPDELPEQACFFDTTLTPYDNMLLSELWGGERINSSNSQRQNVIAEYLNANPKLLEFIRANDNRFSISSDSPVSRIADSIRILRAINSCAISSIPILAPLFSNPHVHYLSAPLKPRANTAPANTPREADGAPGEKKSNLYTPLTRYSQKHFSDAIDAIFDLQVYLCGKIFLFKDTINKLWSAGYLAAKAQSQGFPFSSKPYFSIRVDRTLIDGTLENSLLAQSTPQLLACDPCMLLSDNNQKPFMVVFNGERSTDFGGPFHEFLSSLANEVSSVNSPDAQHAPNFDKSLQTRSGDTPNNSPTFINIMELCPNGTNSQGSYQDTLIFKYSPRNALVPRNRTKLPCNLLPTPGGLISTFSCWFGCCDLPSSKYLSERSHSSTPPPPQPIPLNAELQEDQLVDCGVCGCGGSDMLNSPCTLRLLDELVMYEALGRICAMCASMSVPFNIELNPIVWKKLMLENLTCEDIALFDESTLCNISTISHGDFGDLSFQVGDTSSPNGLCNLVPGGSDIPVDSESIGKYIELLKLYKINQGNVGLTWFAKGFAAVLPLGYIRLMLDFTVVEYMVCGDPEIDINLLKEHTISSSFTLKQNFFSIISDFSNDQLKRLLRFVSGRSRLPPSHFTDWKFRIEYEAELSNPDSRLPTSATCNFRLLVPRYSSLDIFRQRLLYAASNCIAIDLDV